MDNIICRIVVQCFFFVVQFSYLVSFNVLFCCPVFLLLIYLSIVSNFKSVFIVFCAVYVLFINNTIIRSKIEKRSIPQSK